MIKWLAELSVSDACSDNHYHFKDNRVLPVNVTPEIADAEGWWFKPDYIINELNVNSAISRPAHGEVLELATLGASYDVEGYAYSGGGRKVRIHSVLTACRTRASARGDNAPGAGHPC